MDNPASLIASSQKDEELGWIVEYPLEDIIASSWNDNTETLSKHSGFH